MNYHRIQKIIADLLAQPQEISNITIIHGFTQLDLDSDDPLISPLHNHINLLSASMKTQVTHLSFSCLGKDPNAQGNQ